MSPQRPQPRRSALSGTHPAIPPAGQTVTNPEMPPIPATTTRPLSPAARPAPPAAATAPVARTQKMTINVPTELVDEAKNAFWVDRGSYRTFSAWVAEALERQIQETRQRHRIDVLPPRPGDGLPPGRPLS